MTDHGLISDTTDIRLPKKEQTDCRLEFITMARTLLGTMLIASQILTGFWGNATLCLRSDGTICCVHDLAEACTCCEHEHGKTSCSDDHDGHAHTLCAIAGSHEHKEGDSSTPKESVPFELPLTSTDPCGCRHLPLSSGTAPSSQKSSTVTSTDRHQCRQLAQLFDFRREMRSGLVVTDRKSVRVPCCLTVGLTIVSSTVIRC